MSEEPNRHWFRFSLRTLFVVTAIVSACMWFVLSNLVQLRERDRVMQTAYVRWNWGHRNRFQTKLPITWSLLGAKCYDRIDFPSTSFTEDDVAQLHVLFPEAKLSLYHPHDIGRENPMEN